MDKPVFQQLDYSKPPPGSDSQHLDRAGIISSFWMGMRYEVAAELMGRLTPDAIREEWTHYKASNDPPGIVVTSDEEADVGHGHAAWLLSESLTSDDAVAYHDGFAATSSARAAAWTWYDRRLALVESHGALWPDCLAWDDDLCSEIEEGQHPGEHVRQMEEHYATELALVDFGAPPPGWVKDPIAGWAHEPDTKHRRRPIDVAWSLYKSEHNPPGMWIGFSRYMSDLENCRIRVGVSACGQRWEMMPGFYGCFAKGPYKGWVQRARAWAWEHHDRRHLLALALRKSDVLAQRGMKSVPFHQLLCWHDEWLKEFDAWVQDPSLPAPAFLFRFGGEL